MKLYLASKSPRRRALLAQMGVEVELLLLDVPEETRPDESPEAYSLRITCEKLQASVGRLQSIGVLNALFPDFRKYHGQKTAKTKSQSTMPACVLSSYVTCL